MSGAQTPRSKIQKGKVLEDFIAHELRAKGIDKQAMRQVGSGSGKNKGDVWNSIGICFESKNQMKASLPSAMKQAQRESLGTQEPVVVWHPDRVPMENSFVMTEWTFFLELLLARRDNASTGDILDRYRLRDQLKSSLNYLKKRPEIARKIINEVLKNI